jgi:hypothetical protein
MKVKYSHDLPSWFLDISSKEYFEDCISRLDSRATSATAALLTPGRSGAAVVLVRRVADRETLLPLVMKIANDSTLIRKERDNYDLHVKGKLANAPSLDFPGEYILAYTYTGNLLRRPVTLREGYSLVNTSTLAKLIDHLVEVLVSWYVPSNTPHTNVEEFALDLALDPPLAQVLRDLGSDFDKYSFLSEWWDQFLRFGPQNSVPRVFRCHGDLNSGNVTFDGDSIDPVPFLVDFASIENCITHWDFAKLDRDLKTRLYLGDALALGEDFDRMAKAVQAADLSEESQRKIVSTMTESDADQKLLGCVQALRSKVRYMDGSYLFERAYYQSLTFATLHVLYRKDPDKEDSRNIQKKLACVSATALLSRLMQRSIPKDVDFGPTGTVPEIEIERYEEGFKGLTRLHLSAGRFVQMICERIIEPRISEVRFVGITAHALFTDPNFIAALVDQPSNSRSLTLHVYVMKADTSCMREFCQRSSEPVDVLREKLRMSRAALETLSKSKDHNNLRIVLYEFDALPTVNLIQIDNELLFRPYRIGDKLTFLDVYSVVRNGEDEDVERWLDNIVSDLTQRSEIQTLKWSSSLNTPWPR